MGCFNCDKRHVGCHVECEEYKKHQEMIQKRRERQAEERTYASYMIDKGFEYKRAVYKHQKGGGNK